MRRLILGLVLAGVLAGGVVSALAATGALSAAQLLPPAYFGPAMARAEVVVVLGGVVHDLRVDQGRVRGVRPGAIDVAERDGTVQTVPVAADVRVVLFGSPGQLSSLSRGMYVIVIRDGDAPAATIRVERLVRG